MNEREIRAKVSAALKNVQNLSQEEIDAIWQEATDFIRSLPEDERGGFYWNSGGLECLFMFTTESRRTHD